MKVLAFYLPQFHRVKERGILEHILTRIFQNKYVSCLCLCFSTKIIHYIFCGKHYKIQKLVLKSRTFFISEILDI